MKYIFEDAEWSPTANLIRSAYPGEKQEDLIFTGGNGNILPYLTNEVNESGKYAAVYLDVSPGNSGIIQLYEMIAEFSVKHNYNVVVLPIPCAEYYLIKLLDNLGMITDRIGVDLAINKGYFKWAEFVKQYPKHKYKYFEHYCKAIVGENIKQCAKMSGVSGKNHAEVFYKDNCPCKYGAGGCDLQITLREKGCQYTGMYECFPTGSYIQNSKSISPVSIWDIHRSLVDEFNKMCDRYAMADNAHNFKYKHIEAMR